MANYNKRSRIGTILYDKNSYMESIQQNGTEPEDKYMSIEEYKQIMAKIRYTQQLKQDKNNQSTENLFQVFFYIPICIYNLAFCTNSKVSNV
jgi:hypothetical protein